MWCRLTCGFLKRREDARVHYGLDFSMTRWIPRRLPLQQANDIIRRTFENFNNIIADKGQIRFTIMMGRTTVCMRTYNFGSATWYTAK